MKLGWYFYFLGIVAMMRVRADPINHHRTIILYQEGSREIQYSTRGLNCFMPLDLAIIVKGSASFMQKASNDPEQVITQREWNAADDMAVGEANLTIYEVSSSLVM
jgi:hypothetical protein